MQAHQARLWRRILHQAWVGGLLMTLTACTSQRQKDDDPIQTLSTPSITTGAHMRAMGAVEGSMDDPAVVDALYRVLWKPGFQLSVREAAFIKLEQQDVEGLKRSIRQNLPREEAWGWKTRVCQIIAERGWVDLSPALVSSWSRPSVYTRDDLQRPEYLALASLHGADRVTDVVFEMFAESRGAESSALRTRCWDLLHRLGQRERLVALLESTDVPADDALLLDLRAGAIELGIVPCNKEEVLWLRKLREPERSEFWSRAVSAVSGLSTQRRAELELRDLPIIVSASLHDPELLNMARGELYDRVEAYLRGQKRYIQESNYDNFAGGSEQRLYEFKDRLTWGDLAAMMIAVRAVQVPQMVAHVLDYAGRDMVDTSSEYGGIIQLDSKDRFEILEFPPMARRHDNEFISSQAMLDAGYTAIFHFHLHAQRYRNVDYAGPGFGDINYADNTRANCLVFTFVNEHTMNVDYYRHDRVVVDLGVITK
jgi:hypothetical protein